MTYIFYFHIKTMDFDVAMKNKSGAIKPKTTSDSTLVIYTQDHWLRLQKIRKKSTELMGKLTAQNIQPIIYGSVCRGDVSESSDIDLFIPYQISSFKLELALQQEGYDIYGKKIVQATPKHLVKAHILLSEDITITFPLTSIREREFEFIQFGGSFGYNDLLQNKRVPGVDKRLILIEPITEGHKESQIIGYESIVAKKVGVSVELVRERIRILTTRDKVGRTGVYLDMNLASEENIDEVFKQVKDNDPIVRRRAQK
ncbi:MAG TPA: nucleotidyltransferase domain-containing protein [Candidatus Bathyarchaeia archaeon]|nr:nucleotidyltransferase domain-containing protein [Candidatus Bathyarchaeia archaeon]